jgi:gliding motility-associated-like protein
MGRKTLLLFLLFSSFSCFSQLSNFTLIVSSTNETCTANGTLSFNVSGTTAGATILYSVFLLPNTTTPITVTSATNFNGLPSGNYRVIATQSLGANSGSHQQDVTILNQVVNLAYQISSTNAICGNNGVITINVLTGNAVSYEIISGPVIVPSQNSNVFAGLPAGQYQIRVFDNCGEGVVQTHTVQSSIANVTVLGHGIIVSGCNSTNVAFSLSNDISNGIVVYPLNIQVSVSPPNGGTPIVSNYIMNSGLSFSQPIQYFPQQPYNYSISITDGCGNHYTINGTVNNISSAASYELIDIDCSHKRITIKNILSISLVSAPSSYPSSLPHNLTSQINSNNFTAIYESGIYVFNVTNLCGVQETFTIEIIIQLPPQYAVFNRSCSQGSLNLYNITSLILISAPAAYTDFLPHDYSSFINGQNTATILNLPIGNYVFNVVDKCGLPVTLAVTILPIFQTPGFQQYPSCELHKGSVKLIGQLSTVVLISAPSGYSLNLPHDYSSQIINNTFLTLSDLPEGNYVFSTTDSCGNTLSNPITIVGYTENTNVTLFPNCGSFDLELLHTSNNGNQNSFWLQKYFTSTNTWGNPQNGFTYLSGTIPNTSNSIQLTNNTINYNLAFEGQFRILKVQPNYQDNISSAQPCERVVYEFSLDNHPQIIDVKSISCNSNYEVIVNAIGLGPLIYRITEYNGNPFLIQNGNSYLFSNLQAGIYNFQVQDVCGNVLNSLFEISNATPISIVENTLCNGQIGSLVVPNFNFFQYKWWKGNNQSNVLSTTSSLLFNPFNASTDSGIYHVQIIYPANPNSCLNMILDYVIDSSSQLPNAGDDVSLSYCGNQGVINLQNLLHGNNSNSGTWQETTSSGMLNLSNWDSTNVLAGDYIFKYTVSGTCNSIDTAVILIKILPIPQPPIASIDTVNCENQTVHLYASYLQNATYSWSGPNGFLSTNQNPVILNASSQNSGQYVVHTLLNGCQSANGSVYLNVGLLPNFDIFNECVNNQAVLYAVPNSNSFQENEASFSWFGPNGFSSNLNPTSVNEKESGLYGLTVTLTNGCSSTKTIDVTKTLCYISNAITPNNDGFNDNFNLSGFEVETMEVYNRWGKVVYRKDNYINEWYGQNMKGEKLPDSTYYYVLDLKNGEQKTGWVLVVN